MARFQLTPASEILLRHEDHLQQHQLVFAGDLQDDFAVQFNESITLTNQFHHANRLTSESIKTQYGTTFEKALYPQSTLLVYYWPKAKEEAIFQLTQLLSEQSIGFEILIVGENRSGVRSVENRFEPYLKIQKIDTAKRCSLYYAQITQVPQFNLENYWLSYNTNGIDVYSLPGVFSANHLDTGSALLLASFLNEKRAYLNGDILDLCCGNGVLTAVLEKTVPSKKSRTWTLADTQAQAIISAQKTLKSNQIEANVIASDLFSNIEGKFDFIISNPPFHDGQQTDLGIAQRLIQQASNYLKYNGRLRIVANSFLPYEKIMQDTFSNVLCLAKTSRFNLYESIKQK